MDRQTLDLTSFANQVKENPKQNKKTAFWLKIDEKVKKRSTTAFRSENVRNYKFATLVSFVHNLSKATECCLICVNDAGRIKFLLRPDFGQ